MADYLQSTEIDTLSVLISGPIPPDPSELLGSRRMQHLIEALIQAADIVIFDSPPVLVVTDAVVLGRQVDGVLWWRTPEAHGSTPWRRPRLNCRRLAPTF
jgi:Mrp family chromosome partitioning ATPase